MFAEVIRSAIPDVGQFRHPAQDEREDRCFFYFFFFNDTATTEIYTLSLHDALPIIRSRFPIQRSLRLYRPTVGSLARTRLLDLRSEEHTSELQSRPHLVCRLLL